MCFVLTLAQSIKSVPSTHGAVENGDEGEAELGAAAADLGGAFKLDTGRNENQLEPCATWRYILNSTTVN